MFVNLRSYGNKIWRNQNFDYIFAYMYAVYMRIGPILSIARPDARRAPTRDARARENVCERVKTRGGTWTQEGRQIRGAIKVGLRVCARVRYCRPWVVKAFLTHTRTHETRDGFCVYLAREKSASLGPSHSYSHLLHHLPDLLSRGDDASEMRPIVLEQLGQHGPLDALVPSDLLEGVLAVEHGPTLLVSTPPRLRCIWCVRWGAHGGCE